MKEQITGPILPSLRSSLALGLLLALLLSHIAWAVPQDPKKKAKQPPDATPEAEPTPGAPDDADGQAEQGDASLVTKSPPKKFYELEQYDLITLNAANNNEVLKVMPLLFPDRRVPEESKRVGKFPVRLFDKRSDEYEVAWRHVENIVFFEDLVLQRANQLVAQAAGAGDAKKSQAAFDEAFDYFRHILTTYPNPPRGLQQSIQEYLYMNAGVLFREGRVAEAFAILEDLYDQNPQFQYRGTKTVLEAMEALGGQLIGSYIDAENYRGARMLLERLEKTYGTTLKVIETRRQELIKVAETKRDEAAAYLAARQLPQAHVASRDMLKIWPRVQGGADLIAKIAQEYPLVVVGVSQPALEFDPQDLASPASRRCGSLMYRTLVEYTEQKSEGGLYESPWATLQQSDDRRELLFDLRPDEDGKETLTAFDVSRQLLALADPNSMHYHPTWASLMDSVFVEGVQRVHVDLRHPSLLPQAYLQVQLDEDNPAATRYRVAAQSETETRFETTHGSNPNGGPQPVVVERFYAKPRKAVSDLLKGKLDMIDRILPNDALRLRNDPTMVVGTYAFPSIHVLVPNIENPFLANRTFRRALVYGINREVILAKGLLNSKEVPGCQVLSAAIPAGVSRGDPSAYAYDERIPPLPYDPVMAAILMELADRQLAEAATKRQEEAPELDEFVLAHPAGEQAAFICRQIQMQLEVIGIACKLRELPPGQTLVPDDNYDLLYLELVMREPLVDIGRVFGPGGIAVAKEPYVALTLRQLEQAETWKDARERLHELHRLLYEDVTVLPLWQMVDHFAHHKGLRGVSNRPIYLYQNIEQWRVIPPTPDE